MKVSQKIISLILVLTMAMGLATTPSFAAAENTEYENSLKVGWGSTYTNWTAPSGYGYSWNAQVLRFFTEFNTRIKNIYDTLGTTNSVLGDIKTRTGYIPTINDNILKLFSGWGTFPNWSQPSSMGSSWYAWVQKALYQYTSYLYDIVSNTSYLSNYENYLTQITTNSGITSTNTTNIYNSLSKATDDNMKLYRRYGTVHSPANLSPMVVNGLSVPYYLGDMTNPLTMGGYSYSYQASTGNLLLDYLEASNLQNIFHTSKVWTPYSQYRIYDLNDNLQLTARTNNDSPVGFLSIADFMYETYIKFLPMIGKLQYALADDDSIAAKNANKPQEQNVLSNFTGSGSASASTADFTGVKDSVSALKTSLSGGASYSQAFNILDGNSDGWSWFSTEVAESMDTTSNGNTRLRSVPDSTPYLDSYYSELSSYLGFSYNGGIE